MSVTVASTEMNPYLANGVVANAGWLAVAQVVRRLLRLGVLVLIARLLGIENFGAYALLLTVVELVALISGFSYGDFLTREVARHPQTAWPLAKKITQIRFAYTVPCVVIALLLLAALRFPAALILNAALLSVALAPRVVGDSAQGIMKALRRFRLLLWVELAQGAIMLSVAPLLVLKGFGIRGVIAAEILAASAGAVVSVLAIAPAMDFKASQPRGFRELAHSTFAFNVYPFIATIYDRVDVVLLSKLAGNIATGIYSVPYRVFASLSIIPYGIMGALLPVFSASEVNQETIRNCGRAMKFLYLTALLVVLATLGFARPAILAVLGQGYSGSIVTIKILAWASIPVFLNHALNVLLLAAHKEKIFIWTASICTVFNISANLLLIPRFSFVAAAAVTLLTEILLLAQNYYLVTRFLGEPVFPQDGFRITLTFLLVMAGFLTLKIWVPEILAGTLACATFAAFAVRTSKRSSAFISANQRQKGFWF
jgi:O-antigen/teichoic acid export membrane protein